MIAQLIVPDLWEIHTSLKWRRKLDILHSGHGHDRQQGWFPFLAHVQVVANGTQIPYNAH